MVEIKFLDEEACCLREADVIRVRKGKRLLAEVWHDALGRIGKAKMAAVLVGGRRKLWADDVTGSLYEQESLRCLSSSALSVRFL